MGLKPSTRCIICFACLVCSFSAPAFTAADANAEFAAYSNAFYYSSGTNAWFKNNQTGGNRPTYFWGQAEEIECVIDAYEWTSNSTYKTMIANLLNGFIAKNGASWTWDAYNDDIMWAVLAFARGGQDIGNSNYCNIAKANFDACYARAWDAKLGGGLYWSTADSSKNACVNGPGAIAAYLLYKIYHDPGYLIKAANIYNWERAVLFNASSGQVYDNIKTNGVLDQAPTTYNQGTFIGAANFLNQTNDAALAADYTMNHMTSAGILPEYGIDQNNSGFNAIFIRWMARFMKDRGLQGVYQPWLQDNANAAWNVRRTTDNLSWCQWLQPSPVDTNFYSWDCISSLEALLAVPPTQSTSPGAAILTNNDAVGTSSFNAPGNWSTAVAPAWSNDCVVSGVELRTPADGLNHSFHGGSLALTNGGALRLTTGGGATITVGTALSIDNGIVSAWSLPTMLAGIIILRSGGGVFDPQRLNSGGFTVAASISGPGGLMVASDDSNFGGTLYLTGCNTYSGGTTINGPDTLTLANSGTPGSPDAALTFAHNGDGLTIPYAPYTTSAFGTLNLNGTSIGVGDLTGGGGKIVNNAANGTVTLTIGNGNNGGGDYQGVIMDHTALGGGVIALTKTGSGTIIFTGANTYSGGTTINEGTLQLGDGATNNGSVTGNITNDGTLTFANPTAQNYAGTISGSGSLIKTGNGMLTLTGANNYSGSTTISAGILALSGSGSIADSTNVTIAAGATLEVRGLGGQTLSLNSGQILKGGGTVTGNLEVPASATICPTGTLTVQGNVGLRGVLIMGLDCTNAQNSDRMDCVSGTFDGGGTLIVTNLGPALQFGDLFQLFNGPIKGFSHVILPPLTRGKIWINRLAIDGTIQVAVPPSMVPANLTEEVATEDELALMWPADHIGWRLQMQIDNPGTGLGTNWVEVYGASTNDLMTMPIISTDGCVFFRLVYP